MMGLNNILQAVEFIRATQFLKSELCISRHRSSDPDSYLWQSMLLTQNHLTHMEYQFTMYHNRSYAIWKFYKEISKKQSLF